MNRIGLYLSVFYIFVSASIAESAASDHCTFAFKNGICAHLAYTGQGTLGPVVRQKDANSFRLRVWDTNSDATFADGPYLKDLEGFRAWIEMPHMGHGAPPIRINSDIADGSYELEKVDFFMASRDEDDHWELSFQIGDEVGVTTFICSIPLGDLTYCVELACGPKERVRPVGP